jgi:hypothetical protein
MTTPRSTQPQTDELDVDFAVVVVVVRCVVEVVVGCGCVVVVVDALVVVVGGVVVVVVVGGVVVVVVTGGAVVVVAGCAAAPVARRPSASGVETTRVSSFTAMGPRGGTAISLGRSTAPGVERRPASLRPGGAGLSIGRGQT